MWRGCSPTLALLCWPCPDVPHRVEREVCTFLVHRASHQMSPVPPGQTPRLLRVSPRSSTGRSAPPPGKEVDSVAGRPSLGWPSHPPPPAPQSHSCLGLSARHGHWTGARPETRLPGHHAPHALLLAGIWSPSAGRAGERLWSMRRLGCELRELWPSWAVGGCCGCCPQEWEASH